MGQELIFNPMAYDLYKAADKMPVGWYRAQVVEANLKMADYGMGLELHYEIIDGPFAKRKVKKHYNIRHTNPDTMKWACEEVASLQGCMNLWGGVVNTDQMLDIPIQIKLTDKKDSPEYNDVKGYKTIDGARYGRRNARSCGTLRAEGSACSSGSRGGSVPSAGLDASPARSRLLLHGTGREERGRATGHVPARSSGSSRAACRTRIRSCERSVSGSAATRRSSGSRLRCGRSCGPCRARYGSSGSMDAEHSRRSRSSGLETLTRPRLHNAMMAGMILSRPDSLGGV
jgi:hypothetical protein